MKRWTQLALAAGLALSVSACAGDRAPDADRNSAASREGATGTAGKSGLSAADAEFVKDQLAMGTTEVELGKLAQERGSHPDVKNYGQMMMTDHRFAGEELREIANRADAERKDAERKDEATKAAHDEHMELRDELAKLSGAEFDRRYMDEMIKDHEKGITALEGKAEHADHPQIREWAGKTLLKMRNHLAKAKAVQETLTREGDRKG